MPLKEESTPIMGQGIDLYPSLFHNIFGVDDESKPGVIDDETLLLREKDRYFVKIFLMPAVSYEKKTAEKKLFVGWNMKK